MTEPLHILTEPVPEVRSPFLPGTNIQFAWDSTSLGYFKTCPRLYQYIMIEGWSGRDDNIHLRFGIEYHTALQDYDIYKADGADHDSALHMVVKDLLVRAADFNPSPETKAGRYKTRESLIRTVVYYLDKFKDDPAKTFILDDSRPAVELSFRFELDWGPRAAIKRCTSTKSEDGGSCGDQVPCDGILTINGERQGGCGEPCSFIMDSGEGEVLTQPYLLSGHLDRVVDFQGSLYVMDHKTTTSTPGQFYFNQFEPHNQMSLYTLAAKIVLNSPVKGVIIDAAQLLIDDSRFVRGFTYRTADQIDEWVADLENHLSIAESYATNDYWPMNDTACDKFGGCVFREICSKSPGVRETFLASSFTKLAPEGRWNPLKPR